jgi:hypothetical protein
LHGVLTTVAAGEAAPPPGDPRRVLVADVVARVLARLEGLRQHYEAAAGLAGGGPLRETLLALAARKRAQAGALEPLAAALGVAGSAPAASPPATPARWGVLLGEAFGSERALETAARELGALTGEAAVSQLGTGLAAAVARDQETVRRLYLRYT